MAEWEEVQALVITWTSFPEVLTEIVGHTLDECKVLIVTDNSSGVSAQLTAEGIPLDSVFCRHRITPSGSAIAAWAVYHSDVDSLAITDYMQPADADGRRHDSPGCSRVVRPTGAGFIYEGMVNLSNT